jgi:hypothetical protein
MKHEQAETQGETQARIWPDFGAFLLAGPDASTM